MANGKRMRTLFLTVIAVSLFVLPGMAEKQKPVYYEDFNEAKIDGFDITWAEGADAHGVTPVYDEKGAMYAIKTWVSASHPVKLTHTFSQAITDGMFYISFDYQSKDGWNDCYLRLLAGEKQFQICGFRNSGKFGHFLDFSKWALDSATAVDYQGDTWYTVGLLFDMESRDAYLYFGEQETGLRLIETVGLPEDFTGLTDAVLVHSFGDYPEALWDNFRIYTVTPDTIESVEKEEKIVFAREIYEKYLAKIYTADFEIDAIPDLGFTAWTQETAEHGICRINETDGNSVLKTWVNGVYPKRLTYNLKEPMEEGLYYITFDWQSVGGVNDCYLRLLSGDTRYQICGFRNDGNFGQFTNFSNWSLVDETEHAYEADTAYTVGTLLDMDLRKVYVYMGKTGEALSLCAEADFTEDMTSFTDVVLVHSFGDYPAALWDNLEIYKLNAETAKLIEASKKVSFDASVTEPFTCVLTTEYPGNIFHNASTADVSAKYYNRSMVYENISVTYEGVYGNQPIYRNSKTHIVARGGEEEYILTLPVKNRYGFFALKVMDENNGEVISQTRLSNARMAGDGVRNQKLGATIHMTRVDDKEAAFDILSKGGFGIVRGGDNTWQEVETEQNIYTPEESNTQFYRDAVADDFAVMTILSGSNSLYAAEYPTGNAEREGEVENPPQSDGLIEKFGEYCYQTVLMYPEITYFQIWNEWNNAPTFNKDGITDASYYAKLLKAGYEGVKKGGLERGKDAYVVAMAPTGTKPDWIENAILSLEGEKFFDIVSIHPYTYADGGLYQTSTYAPEDLCVRHVREVGDVVTRIRRVRSVLDDYGFYEVPIWAGEFGFSSYICGEEKQAQYAVRMMALNDGNALLDRMLWYTFQNHQAVNETEQNYGMIRYGKNEEVPYEAKPVYLAMSNYNALMAEAEMKEKITDGTDGVYIYRFLARDGSDLYLIWSTDGEKEVKLDTTAGLVKVYDIYGNEEIAQGESGVITVTAQESMTYVKAEKSYLFLTQNNKEITKLSDLEDGDIYVGAAMEGYESLDLIVAQYQDGMLLSASRFAMHGENVNIGKIQEQTEEVCIFMWDGMMPLNEKYVLQ